MNLPLYLARRLYGAPVSRRLSRPAVFMSMAGIAVGLAVMLMAVAVVLGFQREISDKVVGFTSHIRVADVNTILSNESHAMVVSDSLLSVICNEPGVAHVQRYSTSAGMVKTSVAFQGVVLKGIAAEYDRSFLKHHLVEGEFPQFSDSVSSNKVVVSAMLATKLNLHLGDKLDIYFLDEHVRARRLSIVGIYQTHFAEFDQLFMFTDLCMVNRLNKWNADEAAGLEVRMASNRSDLDELTQRLGATLSGHTDRNETILSALNVRQANPSVFAWLDVLDVNIWVILVLMSLIAGFTMISGLLIMIIERTQMIGLLKAMGAPDGTLRKMFLWLSMFVIGRGMLFGNLVALVLYALQKYGAVLRLDPDSYYIDVVPVYLSPLSLILVNVGTLFVSVIMLLGPSVVISHISPAHSMRYE